MKKFAAIAIIGVSALTLPVISFAQSGESYLGKANAPVTVIEYGSLTCSHCAHFANEQFPQLKAQYIDTGKIKYIFRPLPTPLVNLSAGMQVVADCAGGVRRYNIIAAFFKNQEMIFQNAQSSQGVLPTLQNIAASAGGLNAAQINACLADKSRITIIQQSVQSAEKMGIESTPTLVIDGKVLQTSPTQELDMSIIKPALDKALAGKASHKR